MASGAAWTKVWHPRYEEYYFWNKETEASTWTRPDGYSSDADPGHATPLDDDEPIEAADDAPDLGDAPPRLPGGRDFKFIAPSLLPRPPPATMCRKLLPSTVSAPTPTVPEAEAVEAPWAKHPPASAAIRTEGAVRRSWGWRRLLPSEQASAPDRWRRRWLELDQRGVLAFFRSGSEAPAARPLGFVAVRGSWIRHPSESASGSGEARRPPEGCVIAMLGAHSHQVMLLGFDTRSDLMAWVEEMVRMGARVVPQAAEPAGGDE